MKPGVPPTFVLPVPRHADPACGQPLDCQHFDVSGIAALPERGREVRLARFALDPQYCGRLENFCQYTDLQSRDPAEIETPGLLWLILVNQRPLHPYVQVDRILNPWGWGGFPLSLRLDENAVLEFVVRNVAYAPAAGQPAIRRVGARLVGRHWFNTGYAEGFAHE
jgi:hypothetical protein